MKDLNSCDVFLRCEGKKMDYYLAPFSGANYISGKAVSSSHASPVVCQHHTL